MSTDIGNHNDIIDSRDIIERIEELEASEELDSDEKEELQILRSLAEECEQYASDWKYGATLINESYWIEYVQEFLAEIGDLPRDLPHYIEIDWEATAKNIQADYTPVDFDGVTYWIRSC